jgi:hypothetical protein
MQGKVELAEALDTMGNGGRELFESGGGTNASLYPSRQAGWQMGPYPVTVGGEGSRGR